MIKRWLLVKLRKKKGLTIQNVADDLNTNYSVIWRIERLPKHNAEINTLIKLANYYEVSLDSLIMQDADLQKNY